MKSILIKNADLIVTMNPRNQVLYNASIYIEHHQIFEIDTKRTSADHVIDARGKIMIPGLINCHHHMFQCALRGMPELQNQKIEKWIAIVCQMTKKMDEKTIYYSALANMAELLLYGCTTTTDMLYLFPKEKKGFFEATIRAAQDIGIRFHPYRGSMSLSQKDGALFPDDVVQDSDAIASDSEALSKKYHDVSPHSMLRIGLAPCTIFTSSAKDYENAANLSKKYGVNLQTHLGESVYENEYSRKKFKKRPLDYLVSLGWNGKQVSFTHCINVNKSEIAQLAKSKTHVAHCPISNARSPIGEIGIAPIWEMLKAGINIAIGVDGSAGNDSSNLLEELRWTRTLQGIRKESTYLKPIDTLAMGTINGAKLLSWDKEIGSIEVGKIADLALFDLSPIEYAGYHDPVTALISCQAKRADTVIVNGRVIVKNKKITTFDEKQCINNLLAFK